MNNGDNKGNIHRESRPISDPRHRARWLILAVIIGLGLLFLAGWIPHLWNREKIDKLAAISDLPRVVLMELSPNKAPIELVLPTSAQAIHFTPIWSRVNGYLIQFLVDIGDEVEEGDLLAEIDTPETDEQLEQAKADLLNSIAERDIAKITRDRWQKLYEKNPEAVSKQEVDQFQANLESAEAIVLVNEKNVAKYTWQQEFKFIYAPFNGVITQRLIDIGSLIYGSLNGTPQELFQMAQTDVIRFFVDVPQTYYTQIKDGLPAEVTLVQLPGRVFKGNVTRFAKALDPTARTLLTQIDVENKEHLLYPGLFARVKFLLEQDQDNFIIPTTAVIIRSSFPHVAVVDEEQRVHLKQVEIGRDYGNRMEITSGLHTGDQIVINPSDKIREGVKVQTTKSDARK